MSTQAIIQQATIIKELPLLERVLQKMLSKGEILSFKRINNNKVAIRFRHGTVTLYRNSQNQPFGVVNPPPEVSQFIKTLNMRYNMEKFISRAEQKGYRVEATEKSEGKIIVRLKKVIY